MNTSMNMKPKNESLWNKFVSLFRPRDKRAEMRTAFIASLKGSDGHYDEDLIAEISESIYVNNHGEIASDIREQFDSYEIAQEFDTYQIGQEIIDDVCYNLDVDDKIDDKVTENLEVYTSELRVTDIVSSEVEHQLGNVTLTSFSSEVEDIITNIVSEQMGELMETVLAEIADRLVTE